MKLTFALVLSVIVAVGTVAFIFTFYQIYSERSKLHNELGARIGAIADDFARKELPFLQQNPRVNARAYIDSIAKKNSLVGLIAYFNSDSILVSDTALHDLFPQSTDYVSQSIAAGETVSDFFSSDDHSVYQFIKPVQTKDDATAALIFYSDADYIDNIISDIWFRNFLRWFAQAFAVSLVTLFVIRWRLFDPLNKVVEWVKAARVGDVEQLQRPPTNFLAPLHQEIMHIARDMHEARAQAEEEAKLRTSAESVWTAERLKAEFATTLQDKTIVVVSNREPYMHIHSGNKVKWIVPASGLVTAMEPVLNACGGIWIASGTGTADRETVDANDKIQVPPEQPKYTLRRMWLSKEDERHFYDGFSNEGIYPLCLIAHIRPTFRKEDWDQYKLVNERFAQAVLEEIQGQDSPIVLVQDYHFALVPEIIKTARPDAKVAIFWHIPWPNPESFGICPWQKEILRGMLGADLIGFHTQYHCNHFLETVNNTLEARVIWEEFSVRVKEHPTYVKPFPISIAFTLKDYNANGTVHKSPSEVLSAHGISARYMGIGVDRIDYAKGITEKFRALERFLDKAPAYQEKFTFVQIGAPSRSALKAYSDTIQAIQNEAERINDRFKTRNWKPILLLQRHHSHEELLPYYTTADFCMVSSLHDGMNLVAKEYVASRKQGDGSLILSQFAGASQELHGAITINPYDIEQSAEAIKLALEMPKDEQRHRMEQMRRAVLGNNIYYWAASLLKAIVKV